MENTGKKITFEDLRVHYGTSRAYLIHTEGRHKIYGNRIGMKTNLGDLPQKEWSRMARELIRDSGEEELQAALLEWVREHMRWFHSETAREQHALELHMDRIFDDPAWVDYIPFNQRYRPEALDTARLVQIRTGCCDAMVQVTPELLQRAGEGENARIRCSICGRWSRYRKIPPKEGSACGSKENQSEE